MVPLANKPLIRYQIELLRRHGITDIVVCIDHLAERFERYFSDPSRSDAHIRFHRDVEPRGTAGAVKAAESLVSDDTVLVLNGHILTDVDIAELIDFHKRKEACATVYLSPNPDPLRYGVALTDADGRIRRFVEKPSLLDEAPTDTINAGIYVIDRSVLADIPEGVEYSLELSLFPGLLARGAPFYGYVSEAYWQDITTLHDYRKAQEDILTGKVRVEMVGHKEGEQIWVAPNASIHPTADLSGAVVIGKNADIGKNVKIRGPVSLGAFCRVEEGAVVDNSIIWRGSVIERNAVVRSCILGDDCTIRESAAVQEGSVLGDGAVVASYLASLSTAEEAVRRSKIKFGTDGWRGIIADDFTGENVRLVAQSVVDYFREPETPGQPVVLVGYDHRSQSEYFAGEAVKIVAASGLKAILSSAPCSSPALAYMVKYHHARGGIMITASHNPPSFNGLKVKAHYGGSASPAIIARIERHLHRLIDEGRSPEAPRELMAQVELHDLREPFFDHLASLVDLKKICQARLKIVVDPMYGSGAGYLASILCGAGCKSLLEIRSERNPVFGGINPEPIEENMGALSKAVLEHKADIGIALDGDADRVGAVDSKGRFVDCHRIFSVLLRHLVQGRRWTGGVVKTVSTTRMIDKLAAKYKLKLYETPIGFKHVCDLMLQEDILIGGEESGGIGVKNHIPERDGVLMGLLLLEAMAMTGKKLEELIDEIMEEIGPHEYGRIDLHPEPHHMHTIISSLQSLYPYEIAGEHVAEVSRKDGTKVSFEDGSWLLLRPSGTEPVVRVYAEASSQQRVKTLLDAGVEIVQSAK
jgi:phosphomannomutase/NDP-sugar pyrophosphorylase family protein